MRLIVPFPLILAILAFGVLPAPGAVAQTKAGTAEDLAGDATAADTNERHRDLDGGDDILMGDTIRTGSDASILIVFEDKTPFSIGEHAGLTIDRFVYNPNTNAGFLVASIGAGLFRFVSGKVAETDPESMVANTAIATIGIHGTNIGGKVIGTIAEISLLEPEDG